MAAQSSFLVRRTTVLAVTLCLVGGCLMVPAAGVAAAGSLWEPVNQGLDGACVTALAKGQVIIAGTQRDGVYVWRATGARWESSSEGIAATVEGGVRRFPAIQALAVDGVDPGRVVAGTTAGLYVSRDSGITWQGVGSGVLPQDCRCVVVSPDIAGLVLVGAGTGLYRSTDFGQTWTRCQEGMGDRIVSCISFDAVGQGYVFAGTSEGLYRSLDGGVSWRRLNRPVLDRVTALMQDGRDPTILTAGTTYGILRSVDGGTNWRSAPGGTGCGAVVAFGQWLDGTSVVAICRGGLLASADSGDSWSRATGADLPPGEFLSGVTLATQPSSVVLGTADGVWFMSRGASVLQVSGLGSPAAGAVTYSTAVNRFYVVKGTRLFTGSGTGPWAQAGSDIGNAGVHALVCHPTQRNVLFAGADLGLLRSNDGGASWSAQALAGISGSVRAIAVAPDGLLMLVATASGVFGGDPATPGNWTHYSGAPTGCTALTWSRVDTNRVYAVASGCVHVSSDRGKTWASWEQELERLDIVVCAVHQTGAATEQLLVGGGDGAWVLLDARTPAQRLGKGLEGVAVWGLCSQPGASGGVLAGTSAGVFSLAAKEDMVSPAIVVDSPRTGQTLRSSSVIVAGVATDSGAGVASVTVNGVTAAVDAQGRFSCKLVMGVGTGRIDIFATDRAGNESTASVEVNIQPPTTLVLTVGSTTMLIDGRAMTLDCSPIIVAGRTLLPIRPVIEALGGQTVWDPAQREVDISVDEHSIRLWIGNAMALVDGVSRQIDANAAVTPLISGGRTMLPLRFVVESVGASVKWDPTTRRVTIVYPDLAT